MKQELFSEGASRGRSEIAIVTSDREQLCELLGISSARPSATELVEEQTQLQKAAIQGFTQSISANEFNIEHGIGFSL